MPPGGGVNKNKKTVNAQVRTTSFNSSFVNSQQVYFTGKSSVLETVATKAKRELTAILKQKIGEHGAITSEMIDKKIARLLFLVSTDAYPNAHAPYSNFRVGCAVISQKGRVYKGVNIENITYNSNLHGETTALSNMVIHEGSNARVVASATCSEKLNPVTSCGSCRQNLAELSDTWNTKLITATKLDPTEDDIIIDSLGDMLPKGFSPTILRTDNIK